MCAFTGIEGSDDEALDAAGQDEEVSRWEQEQIRKGISIPQVSSTTYLQKTVLFLLCFLFVSCCFFL